MISQKKVLGLFIAARERQAAEHHGDVIETEAQIQDRLIRLQRADDILNLTAKFGGDFKKATTEYIAAKQDMEAFRPHTHRHQPNANWFGTREAALVKLAEVMEGNSVLEEVFETLFHDTAVAAICRNYSNGRGFFFLAPFIGGVVVNRMIPGWNKMSLEKLQAAVEIQIPIARRNFALGTVGADWCEKWLSGGKAPFIHTRCGYAYDPFYHVIGWRMVDMETGKPQGAESFCDTWRVATLAEWEILRELKVPECDEVPRERQGFSHWTEKVKGVLTFAQKMVTA
jgi:hypothetical protein